MDPNSPATHSRAPPPPSPTFPPQHFHPPPPNSRTRGLAAAVIAATGASKDGVDRPPGLVRVVVGVEGGEALLVDLLMN